MASELSHIELANRNHSALEYLLNGGEASHPEWVVTIAFYKAVHVVEAVFAHKMRTHSQSHDSRMKALKTADGEIFKPFKKLYSASTVARYLCDLGPVMANRIEGSGTSAHAVSYKCFSEYISSEDIRQKLLRRCLDVVEQKAVSQLSDDAKGRLKRTVHLLGE